MDREELDAPLAQAFWWLLAAGALVLAILAYGLRRLLRLRQQQQLVREAAHERERQALNERVASLTRDAGDLMLLTDQQGQILEANEAAVEAYGYPLVKLRQMTLRELMAPHTRADFDRQILKVTPGGVLTMRTDHQRKDGSTLPVDFRLRAIDLAGVRYFQVVIGDLTARHRDAEEIQRLTRHRAVLNRMARAITQSHSEPELLGQVCRLALEEGGLKLAWIGWHDPATRVICATASASADPEPLPDLTVSSEDSRTEGRGPAGTALREQKTVVFQELSADARATVRKETAGRAGIQSCAAFPLRRAGRVCGVLCLYAPQPQAFGEREAGIWEDVAAQVSLALGRGD